MNWTPFQGNHSIVDVRIVVLFSNPMSIRKLDEITKSVVENFQNFGFEQKIRSENFVQNFPQDPNVSRIYAEKQINGWVINRKNVEKYLEQATFCDIFFSYVTSEYDRWDNFIYKFFEIFDAPLMDTFGFTDISNVKLEYWNKFSFQADISEIDLSKIVETVDNVIPNSIFKGESLWHSHAGWFENISKTKTLINRNIDIREETVDNNNQKEMNIYTLIDSRPEFKSMDIEKLKNLLSDMHKKSAIVFGSSISESYREMIGLKLEDYVL